MRALHPPAVGDFVVRALHPVAHVVVVSPPHVVHVGVVVSPPHVAHVGVVVSLPHVVHVGVGVVVSHPHVAHFGVVVFPGTPVVSTVMGEGEGVEVEVLVEGIFGSMNFQYFLLG